MTTQAKESSVRAPEWFGAAARDIAPFPILMSGYSIFYAIWWPIAWGWIGAGALLLVLVAAGFFTVRGIKQIRHAGQFPNNPSPEIKRERKAMSILNGVTHPLYLIPSVPLFIFDQGRWILPLMIFVIGAHFLPMGRILGRKIDYLLGPLTMLVAVIAGVLALNPSIPWQVVFGVAATGGAVITLCYAAYLARAYRLLCEREGVPFT